MRAFRAVLTLLFVATLIGAGPASAAPPPIGANDWYTYHGSASRSGYATSMPAYHGGLRVTRHATLDGAVYAQPIVVAGLTVVATENNTVFAFDSALRIVWRRHLAAPSPASERPCGNIDPLGITGTPIYSSATGLVYVAAEISGKTPSHRLYGLDLRTGALKVSRTLDYSGVDQRVMQERGALAIAGGRVWTPFGGLAGDCGAYKGRVIGYRLDGTGVPLIYTVPTPREGGIWTPPGPSVDSGGHLFVSVGNGQVGNSGGAYDYSDSVTEISSASGHRINYFSPADWRNDNDNDLDLGSLGPALVGRWVFADGKSGFAYTIDGSRFGGIGARTGTAVCKAFGGTAVVASTVLLPCSNGIRRIAIDQRTGGLTGLWYYGGATGSPVYGGGVVWTLNPGSGQLLGLDLVTGHLVARVGVGTTTRFATPAITGRSLIVGTQTGVVVASF